MTFKTKLIKLNYIVKCASSDLWGLISRISHKDEKDISEEEAKLVLDMIKGFDMNTFELNDMFFEEGKPIQHDSPYHKEDIYEHVKMVLNNVVNSLDKVSGIKNKIVLFLSALLHDVGKPLAKKLKEKSENESEEYYTYHDHDDLGEDIARKFLNSKGISDDMTEQVCSLVKGHMNFHGIAEQHTKGERVKSKVLDSMIKSFDNKEDALKMLSLLGKADSEGKIPDTERLKALNKEDYPVDYHPEFGKEMYEKAKRIEQERIEKEMLQRQQQDVVLDDVMKNDIDSFLKGNGLDIDISNATVVKDVYKALQDRNKGNFIGKLKQKLGLV